MDTKGLLEYVDNQRWLMNSGLLTESAKNQLFTYGTIIHPNVQSVELDIQPETKEIRYKIYFNRSMLNKVDKYTELSKSTGFWGLRRFKRFLEKEGDLNFENILTGFVNDFCGPGWSISLQILDTADYTEGYGDDDIDSTTENRQSD